MAVAEERQRLARELHDSVTQVLHSVTLYTDAARMALAAGKQTAVAEYLDELRSMVRQAMLDMRLLIFELHPPALEVEVLRLVAQGLSNETIAKRLSVAEVTVRTHVSHILDKLHLANRVQATLYALREGLTSLNEEEGKEGL